MRMIIGLALLLTLPAVAAAQQTAPAQQGDAAPVVELQQSIPAPTAAPAPATAAPDLQTQPDAGVEAAPADAADAEMQAGPESRRFWYLVGAIVVAGIILAVVL